MSLPRPGSGAFTPALVCGVLLAGLAVQIAWPVTTTFAPSERRMNPPLRSPVAAPVPDYEVLLARPLFSPDRRTAGAGGAGAVGAAEGDSQRPMLIGVVSDRRAGSAVIRGGDGAAHVVRLGESWRGWRLVSLGAKAATFDSPNGRFTALISAGPSSNSVPPPPFQEARP